MTEIVATIKGFIFGRQKPVSTDPVFRFFFETSSGKRKKVYRKALQKTQTEQERVAAAAQAGIHN